MTFIISDMSIAQAATIMNTAVTIIQHSLSLSLAILLIFFIPEINSAVTWNSISRMLHSSLWPTIFRVDTSWNKGASNKAIVITYMSTVSTILIPIAGITLPLGLRIGPLVPSEYQLMEAQYMPDVSALALATTPNRDEYQYGRVCGDIFCPDNDGNTTAYSPSIINIFNSTPHGPFSMQFRRFYNRGSQQNLSRGLLDTSQSLILRNDVFVTEGLIVDMSLEHPGVGLWNQTMPNLTGGGTWTQDVLWLEPVTECVNSNLTVGYSLADGPESPTIQCNITDRGGFVNLTHEIPSLTQGGQYLDLAEYAYRGAIYSNSYIMKYLNATRESSSSGKSYRISDFLLSLTKMASIPLDYNLAGPKDSDTMKAACQGFGRQDAANISKPSIACGGFLGFTQRTDGGDSRSFEPSSTWSQKIYICTSATRARIQRTTFSTNDTSQLQELRVSRQSPDSPVLWAVERTNMSIGDIELMWGRVDKRFEGDQSLSTFRNEYLYLPAGASSQQSGITLIPGQPLAAHAIAWNTVYSVGRIPSNVVPSLMDYTGAYDYAVQNKFQSIIRKNPIAGPAQIHNIIWTDIMANAILGTQTNTTLLVAPYQKSIEYDFRFAIPGFILLAIWAPAFSVATGLLATRLLTFRRMQKVLHHTSVGQAVVGSSALRVLGQGLGGRDMRLNSGSLSIWSQEPRSNGGPLEKRSKKGNWGDTIGATPVVLDFRQGEIIPSIQS